MNSKLSRLAVVLSLVLCVLTDVCADDVEDFASAVNAAWAATNDAEIVNLVNLRLAQDTNDTAALSVKMYYHLWVDGNITNAHEVATNLDSILQASTNQVAKDFFAVMKSEVDSVPLSESGAFGRDALDALRQQFQGLFPNIRNCVWLSKALSP